MRDIRLSEEVFQSAQKGAAARGFESVEDYLAEIVQQDMNPSEELLFTPERLEHIDRAARQVDAGEGVSSDELGRRFDQLAEDWRDSNAS